MHLIAIALLAVTLPASADLYKCPVNGANVYQDKPCKDGKKLDVPELAAPPVVKVVPNTPVKIGMKDTDVYSAWGLADKVNRTINGSSVAEQWVYYRSRGRAQYLYFKDGILTSAQSSE